MLFKILHGDDSRISMDITPFHEGYCYVTHDGYLYFDINVGTASAPENHRLKLNAKDAETLSGASLSTILNSSDLEIPTSKAVLTVLANYATVASVEALETEVGKKAAASDLTSHTNNRSNPHGVTKSNVGLGNVPNVATNDQTPTYTQSATLTNLTSGEKLSVSFGKIMKAIADFISHLANKSNPHGVTAAQAGAVPTGRTVNGKALSGNISLSAGDVGADASGSASAVQDNLDTHTSNTSNPHGVTLGDLGVTATAAELNYLDGVTSNIQTQLSGKAASSHNHTAAQITSGTLASDRLPTVPIAKGGTGAANAAAARANLGAVSKKTLTLTLSASSWTNNSITVTATGATASNTIFISPAVASQTDYTAAGVVCTAQAANSLTFTCTTVPNADLMVNIVILD